MQSHLAMDVHAVTPPTRLARRTLLLGSLFALAPLLAPRVAAADGPASPSSSSGRRRARRPLRVALDTTGADPRARALLADAFGAAIARNPAFEVSTADRAGAALVLTASVRSLRVERDPVGALARCEVSVVMADVRGAVRGALDARGTARGDTRTSEEAVARAALEGAVARLVVDLAAQADSARA